MRLCPLLCILGTLAVQALAQSNKPSFSSDVATWDSLPDLTPSVDNRTLTVLRGRVRFGTELCSFNSVSKAFISSGAESANAKLYVSDSCAIVLEYPNTLKLNLDLSNITAAAVALPSVPATALYLADINIDERGFALVADKRSALSAFSAMAGSGIVIDCSAGPCLFSIDPATVMTLGGTNSATGVADNRRATRTFPARIAAADPPTCIVAEQFFNTTANVRKDCTAANTWTTPNSSGSAPYQRIDSQAGFTTAISKTSNRVATTSIPSIPAGKCVQWNWTGWAGSPGIAVAISYGSTSLPIPGALSTDTGATITGMICNNRGGQNAQTLSASSSPGTLQHSASSVNSATAQNLTLTMTGETSVTTQLWTVSQVN